MESSECQNPETSTRNTENNPLGHAKRKTLKFWLAPAVVLLIAFCIGMVIKDSCGIHFDKLAMRGGLQGQVLPDLIWNKLGFWKELGFWKRLGFSGSVEKPTGEMFPYWVLWMAPFLSGGGYSSEAWSYVAALDESKRLPRLRILQHGDLENLQFWNGLPGEMKSIAMRLYAGNFELNENVELNETVVICHSEPGAWHPPLFETMPCPPSGYDEPLYVIGRTMFESDRVNVEHVRRCNKMDSVWVPTDFHVQTFVNSGVDPSKVVKVVQSVDVNFFDPRKWEPLKLRTAGRLFGPKVSDNDAKFIPRGAYVFLSIFKWEWRKGWDVLLKAYLEEFTAEDNVVLYILTKPYHSDRDFNEKVTSFVKSSGLQEPAKGWPAVYVSDDHIAQYDLPRLYKAASAFVLPSRGEGWGRPHVEAMAMTLPVIATNWSGPTEYMTDYNSYPLALDGMSEIKEGPFQGHFWAEPSSHQLRDLLRHVLTNPVEAKSKGLQARLDMVSKFSPAVVGRQVLDQLLQIKKQSQENL